jgi:hypothetical protein
MQLNIYKKGMPSFEELIYLYLDQEVILTIFLLYS